MIEIREGWTADEETRMRTVQEHNNLIKRYQAKIASSESMLHQLRLSCTHQHVRFEGQDMFCEVCGIRLYK